MRVLFVINSLGAGGAEVSLAEMLPPMRAAGVVPLVACFERRQEGSEAAVLGAGVDVRYLGGASIPVWAARLRSLVVAWRPDIVHTTIFEADVAGRLGAMGTGAAVVTSLVNTSYDPVRRQDPNVSTAKLRLAQLLDGFTARHLTRQFHAITQAVKTAAVDCLGLDADRITVIERGRDATRLGESTPERRRRAREALGLHADAEVVLNVGRQEFQKGHTTLLEAMGLLAGRPRLVLLQAGRRGAASDTIDAMAFRSQLDDRVRILGHRTDVPELLAAADVFAFPSRYEGQGGSVVEAMALGLPVVATDVPALAEVLEDGGNAHLVPVDDPTALAGAIAGLLDDGDRRAAFGRRSRSLFAERFTLERSVERMLALYGDVINTGV